jgi:hypothetical protein
VPIPTSFDPMNGSAYVPHIFRLPRSIFFKILRGIVRIRYYWIFAREIAQHYLSVTRKF